METENTKLIVKTILILIALSIWVVATIRFSKTKDDDYGNFD